MKQEKIKFVPLTYSNDKKTYVKADTIVQLSEIDGKTYVYTINGEAPIIVKERMDEILGKIGGTAW